MTDATNETARPIPPDRWRVGGRSATTPGRRMVAAVIAGCFVIGLAGCRVETDTADGGGSAATSVPGATASAGVTTAPLATAAPVATLAPAIEVSIAVGGDGLHVVNGPAIALLAFGSGRAEVVTTIEGVLGSSPEVLEVSPECGNQPDEALRWPGRLRIDIRDDRLISWQLDQGSTITTISGVGLGSTRVELEDSLVIEVAETSLGIEFSTNPDGVGLAGLLTGPAATDTVDAMWAGEICAFR